MQNDYSSSPRIPLQEQRTNQNLPSFSTKSGFPNAASSSQRRPASASPTPAAPSSATAHVHAFEHLTNQYQTFLEDLETERDHFRRLLTRDRSPSETTSSDGGLGSDGDLDFRGTHPAYKQQSQEPQGFFSGINGLGLDTTLHTDEEDDSFGLFQGEAAAVGNSQRNPSPSNATVGLGAGGNPGLPRFVLNASSASDSLDLTQGLGEQGDSFSSDLEGLRGAWNFPDLLTASAALLKKVADTTTPDPFDAHAERPTVVPDLRTSPAPVADSTACVPPAAFPGVARGTQAPPEPGAPYVPSSFLFPSQPLDLRQPQPSASAPASLKRTATSQQQPAPSPTSAVPPPPSRPSAASPPSAYEEELQLDNQALRLRLRDLGRELEGARDRARLLEDATGRLSLQLRDKESQLRASEGAYTRLVQEAVATAHRAALERDLAIRSRDALTAELRGVYTDVEALQSALLDSAALIQVLREKLQASTVNPVGSAAATSTLLSLDHAKESVRRAVQEAYRLPEAERKSRIRQLQLRWHPDKHQQFLQELASEITKLINECVAEEDAEVSVS